MTQTRMDEATINASLDACLHGAKEGDIDQARRLHELLDLMLTERETKDGGVVAHGETSSESRGQDGSSDSEGGGAPSACGVCGPCLTSPGVSARSRLV